MSPRSKEKTQQRSFIQQILPDCLVCATIALGTEDSHCVTTTKITPVSHGAYFLQQKDKHQKITGSRGDLKSDKDV